MAREDNGRPTLKTPALILAGDNWEEPTAPDAPNAVTNMVLLRCLQKLEKTMHWGFVWLAVSIGALAIVVGFLVWLWRPGG